MNVWAGGKQMCGCVKNEHVGGSIGEMKELIEEVSLT